MEILKEKFNLKPHVCDLFNYDRSQIKEFLQRVLNKKEGLKDKHKQILKNKTRRESTSPKLTKKSASNSNTNASSPYNINFDTKSLNLNQKRTHSVKKNLSEIFGKLTLIKHEV